MITPSLEGTKGSRCILCPPRRVCVFSIYPHVRVTDTLQSRQPNGRLRSCQRLASNKRKKSPPPPASSHKWKQRKGDKEYGVTRGVDFIDVPCVLNFDLPSSSRAYTHCVGRTARRAGRSGVALSFVVPSDQAFLRLPLCTKDIS